MNKTGAALRVGCAAACSLVLLAGCGSDEARTSATAGATGASGPSGAATNATDEGGGPFDDNSKSTGAVATVRRYYELIDAGDFAEAWPILPASVQSQSGGFDQWRQGYAASVSTVPSNVTLESEEGDLAVVTLDLSAVDRDACTGDDVHQDFSGSWTLRLVRGDWKAQSLDVQKTSGGTPALDASECGPPEPPTTTTTQAPAPAESCTPGYSPCLSPASDYDCEGGTGDGPEYTGTVAVTGSDPYGLDTDSDGVGCE